jgi:hypothetical protein
LGDAANAVHILSAWLSLLYSQTAVERITIDANATDESPESRLVGAA